MFSGGLTDIILIPPLEANLEVVIVQDHPIKLVEQLSRLLGLKLIDPLGE